jgi:hypothetical protein
MLGPEVLDLGTGVAQCAAGWTSAPEDARVRRWRGKERSEARSSEAMCASKREISACGVGERGDMWFRNKNGPGIRAGVR